MVPPGRRHRILKWLVGLAAVCSAQTASGAPHDFKVLEGVVLQPLVLPGDPVAQLLASDGTVHYVDLRYIEARLAAEALRIEARTAVTVAGYEGERPDQIAAHMFEVRNPIPLPPVESRRSVDLRVLEGVVQSVTRRVLQLRTLDGRTMAVRIGSMVTSSAFLRGDRLKVLGVVDPDDIFAANAVVQDRSSRAAVDPAGYGP